jgi:hypothetical protein
LTVARRLSTIQTRSTQLEVTHVSQQVESFLLKTHDETAQGVRELRLDDPRLEEVAGGSDKYCCVDYKDFTACGPETDA